jgi:hypothetical protein
LRVKVPEWCHDELEHALSEKSDLFPVLETLLLDLYHTKHLAGIAEPVSLLYKNEVEHFDRTVLYYNLPEQSDAFWTNIRRDAWIEQLLSQIDAVREKIPVRDDEIRNWLEQQSFFELKNLMCAASQHRPWPVVPRDYFRSNASDLLRKWRSRVRTAPDANDIKWLQRWQTQIMVGPIPLTRAAAMSNTIYVGDTNIKRDEFFQKKPKWSRLVKTVLREGYNLVLQGENGVVTYKPKNEYKFLKALYDLGVSSVQRRDANGQLRTGSVAEQLLLLKPERALQLERLGLKRTANVYDTKIPAAKKKNGSVPE